MEFDFSQNQVVDSIDSVPQDFRGLYSENDEGKQALRTDDAGVKSAVSAITRLNSSLKASRAEGKALKGKAVDMSGFADYGETPETILENFKEQLAEASKVAKKGGDKDAERQIEKIKADLAKGHATAMEGKDARIGALTKKLYNVMFTGEAKSSLADAGVIDPDLALPFLQNQVKVAEEDGDFKVNVVDQAGDLRYSGTTGAPMNINELVAEMKGTEKYQTLFKSEALGGGDTKPGAPARKPGAPQVDKSPQQKIADGLKARQSGGRR